MLISFGEMVMKNLSCASRRKTLLAADFVCQAWEGKAEYLFRLGCKITCNFVMK